MRPLRLVLLGVLLAATLVMPLAFSDESPSETADGLFEKKNYKDAAVLYEGVLAGDTPAEAKRHAEGRVVLCWLRLERFDDALKAAEAAVARTKGTPQEARAHRFAGNLWLEVPHWGTRAGGEFHRAEWRQGMQVRSFRHDKKRAMAHLETARDLFAAWDAGGMRAQVSVLSDKDAKTWHDERLECLFDLAGAAARFGIYENGSEFWWGSWAERDDAAAETAGEDDFQESSSSWELQRKRPLGLRLGIDGQPIFATLPDAYAIDLGDDAKILYLFQEIRDLDRTANRRPTALATYRQAMLARARFGMDRMDAIASSYWTDDGYPLQEEMTSFQPWDLSDGQALVLAGGKIRVVDLPPQWDPLGLLGRVTSTRVTEERPASGLAAQAQYAAALYYQTRQQYVKALEAYAVLAEHWPKSDWAANSEQQVQRIRTAQVHVNQTGVQLPGRPAGLQISYRNASRVHFVAYRIDLLGFFHEIRDQSFKEFKGPQDIWSLSNWHQWFVQPWNEKSYARKVARRSVGEEVLRWSDTLEDDGSYRFAEAKLQTPLDSAGAYLVVAFLDTPPAAASAGRRRHPIDQGVSRAVVVLTDLALVEKPTAAGNLYFVAEGETGAPVAGAKIEVAEFYSIWDQKRQKSRNYRAKWERTSDADGLAQDPRPKRQTGSLHVLASAGSGENLRLAWSGMWYWRHHSPSGTQEGKRAWTATDRPVYRPGHTVRSKTWVRRLRQGKYEDGRAGPWKITVVDPRGNKVHEASGRSDDFGGFDDAFKLGEECPLGVYRIQVAAANWSGGANFRVEEYKKPEFEVTVEPASRHAKLGDKVEVAVKADYYFGAPVAEGEVHYKVFREEYRHRTYAPGAWDWLYGRGYGQAWYSSPWFPWWDEMTCCWGPPAWWWGFYGSGHWGGSTPVRELVAEGDGRLSKDGTFDLEIDTSAAARDHSDLDHRYVVQAEVRDASRRTIAGEGSVKVTRHAAYALLTPEAGWIKPGEQLSLDLRCLTPDNEGVQVEGVVIIAEVQFADDTGGGPSNAEIRQQELTRFKATTDEAGHLRLAFRPERSGQLLFTFEAPDAWGGILRGRALAWVCGEDFDGKLHRFNDLELITDKRTYAPGETAHVLVNTKRQDSWVLFGSQVDSGVLVEWQMLHLVGGSQVVDVVVKEGGVPNFFIEATTVSDLRVHQQVKRICVPPTDGMIDVQVTTDAATYEAGSPATFHVKATKLDGSPAEAQITLAAFDRSVLQIQSETTPALAKFFHGNVRQHNATLQTNLLERFSSWGNVTRPYRALHPMPPSWGGRWGFTVGDWRRAGDRDQEATVMFGLTAETRSDSGRGSDLEGADACEAVLDDFAPPKASPCAPCASAATPPGARVPQDPAAPAFEEATVRQAFADTALWQTTLLTGKDGTVETTVDMPENLTTWKVNAYGMTRDTRVGQATTSCVTTKNLIVRLQAPRFFMELDEVVLSANVHNYLEEAKKVRVSLEVPTDLLKLIGSVPATVDIDVEAGGEARVDWRVAVQKEGRATLLVKALTDEESDAVQMAFPVLVHGMMKQVATTASMRPGDLEKTLSIDLVVPEKRRPELSRLEVQFAPSLVGAMLDALPYCLHYPYGCTEQTVSRFLPAVLTLKTLRDLGIDLEDVKHIRGRMAEERRIREGEGLPPLETYAGSPVFDAAEMQRVIDKGLQRLARMQNGDGGWGWWTEDASNAYLTSYVLQGLLSAREADVEVGDDLIQRGVQYLLNHAQQALRHKGWAASEHHAFVAYVLGRADQQARIEKTKEDTRPPELLERLWIHRDTLNVYGKSLLSLALADAGDMEKATTVLENVLQYVEQNEETQVAWVRTPRSGWWYWWNNDIESNAWALRALVRLKPKSDVAPRIVKWLLNNRRGGAYWRSTRDTTLCVAAMSAFVAQSGENSPDYTLRLDLDDGQVVKEVKISKDNFFTFDRQFVVEGLALSGGKHTLKVTKTGPGALYMNTYLSYFTTESHITAAGHELEVERRYFLLKRMPHEVEVMGADGQPVLEKRLRYERVQLEDGQEIESGDLIQVELEVTSDNTYTYLAFEDMKPAGCEPVEVQSGGTGQEGFWSNMELRDEKVVFFVGSLSQGKHLLRYRLRAEIPGTFHALPTKLFAMYVPELKANAEEMLLRIRDR